MSPISLRSRPALAAVSAEEVGNINYKKETRTATVIIIAAAATAARNATT